MKIVPEWPELSPAEKLVCQANTFLEAGASSETVQKLYLQALDLEASPLIWRNLGRLYAKHEIWEDAETCFKNADAQLWLAVIYERVSRYEDAWIAVNKAPPGVGRAKMLGRIARFMGHYQEGIEALKPYDDVQGLFELAKLYDKAGDYEQAWQTAARANAAKGDRCSDPFPDLSFEIPRENRSESPIFIVGMPRSGTTLMERMLAQHPQVESLGESEFFNVVADNLIQGRNVTDIGAGYLLNHPKRTVDKAPMNLRHVDLIRGTFPDARFIHMKRDPDDIAISCFMRLFDGKQPWAYHWDDIQNAIRRGDELATGRDLHEVRYEDLVERPQEILAGVLAHCGLEWDEACLHHDADRTNHSGSYEETRKPIFKDSVGRAANYRAYMPRKTQTNTA